VPENLERFGGGRNMKKKIKTGVWISLIVVALIVGGVVGANLFGNTQYKDCLYDKYIRDKNQLRNYEADCMTRDYTNPCNYPSVIKSQIVAMEANIQYCIGQYG